VPTNDRLLLLVVYGFPVNAPFDVVGPGLGPSPQIQDLCLGKAIGGELLIRTPLGGTQPSRKTFQTELVSGKATTKCFQLAL
jgi:hypothetical protein